MFNIGFHIGFNIWFNIGLNLGFNIGFIFGWILGLNIGFRVANSLGTGEPGYHEMYQLNEFFGRIHALSRIDKFNWKMGAHKKWFLVTRINFLGQEFISRDKNWFFVKRMDFIKPQMAYESRYLGRNIGQGI